MKNSERIVIAAILLLIIFAPNVLADASSGNGDGGVIHAVGTLLGELIALPFRIVGSVTKMLFS